MSLFLLFFLTIYSAMHALFYATVRVLLPEGGPARLLLILFLLLMVLAPMGAHFLQKFNLELPARLLAVGGFQWLGFLFLSVVFFFFLWGAELILRGLGLLVPVNLPSLIKSPWIVSGLVLVLCASIYGFFESRNIRTEILTIQTPKLPAGVDTFTIAQISDVHLGLIGREGRLRMVLNPVIAAKPDMLVSTGDLLDGMVVHLKPLSESLEAIKPQYGKWAIIGNHEVYPGLDHSLRFLKNAGFEVLREEGKTVAGIINLAGVDDPAVFRGKSRKPVPEEKILSPLERNGLFTLLLKHRPEVEGKSLGLFDLQLSGHAHRGQIYPFNYVVAREYPLLDGFYELVKGSAIYTSRGSGTWGPQMRLLSPPEVTLIRLERIPASP